MTKKKRKLKKKALAIITVTLIIILLIPILFLNKNEPKTAKKESKKTNELGDIAKKIDFYKDDYTDRYLAYKKANPNLSNEKVIVNVNIGLDYPYYENVQKTKYLNTSYIIVNKYNSLDSDYVPSNMEKIDSSFSKGERLMVDYAQEAFEELARSALEEGYNIYAMSTYRSYEYQNSLYNNYVSLDGQDKADTYSARAGFSEHQTGLAADVCNKEQPYTEFENTKEFNWMQENAYKYGFILRYPKDKVEETGYMYEPWHYRYVGKEIAEYIHQKNITYEEYYVRFIESKKDINKD